MQRFRPIYPAVATIVAMLSGAAFAADPPTERRPGDTTTPAAAERRVDQATDQHGQIARASKWIGMAVHDADHNTIAKVDDIVVRPDGKVAYVVLLHGATAGLGGTWYAAPMGALKPHDGDKALMLSINEAELKTATTIDKDNWPTGADAGWQDGLNRKYRVQADKDRLDAAKDRLDADKPQTTPRVGDAADPAARTPADALKPAPDAQSTRILRVSKLMGLNLSDNAGAKFAEVHDVLLDTKACRASFVLVSYGGTLGVGKSIAAAPFSVLNVTTNEKNEPTSGTLATDQARIKANTISEDSIPQLAERDRATRVYESYQQTPYWETFGTERDRPLDINRDQKDPSAPRDSDTDPNRDPAP